MLIKSGLTKEEDCLMSTSVYTSMSDKAENLANICFTRCYDENLKVNNGDELGIS